MSSNKISVLEFEESFRNALEQFPGTSYAMVQRTDRFEILRLSDMLEQVDLSNIKKHGMEIRLFNVSGEMKWMRPSIAEDSFYYRECMNDEGLTESLDYWDEEQYLDIDTKRSNETEQKVVTTGGGSYGLPILQKEDGADRAEFKDYSDLKIVIRNYLDFEPDTGRAFIKDWRIVKFTKGE